MDFRENESSISILNHLFHFVFTNFFFKVRAKFTVDDHGHYLFTPCILTQWVLGLFRYNLSDGKSLNFH